MRDQFFFGLVLGLLSGSMWPQVFMILRRHQRRQRRDERTAMRRHLQDLELDIEKGKTP